MDAGRYPAQVYPIWLRALVTFVIPIAVATTVPLQALRGELLWWQVLMFLGISAASLLIAAQVWKAGVRRLRSASAAPEREFPCPRSRSGYICGSDPQGACT